MNRLSADSAPPQVKEFVRSLTLNANGVEVTLGGNVVCKIIPPAQLSEAQKTAQLDVVRNLLAEARARSKRLPASKVEGVIRNALKKVREER
ncbi:MAG: hypothetical protein ACJ8FY_05065 [Gemmataceae bacterium]